MDGKLITLEGISGIGKSFYFGKLSKMNTNPDLIFNKEITDEDNVDVNKKIFEMLTSTNSPFFDIGNPKLATLLIAAKQANDEDTFVIPSLVSGKSVISDRGYDTICVLQGLAYAQAYGGDPMYYAKNLYKALSVFNIIPDRTILLTGEVEKAIRRAEIRNGKDYTPKEREFLRICSQAFLDFSEEFKDRYEYVNVDEGYDQTIHQLKRIIKKEGINL